MYHQRLVDMYGITLRLDILVYHHLTLVLIFLEHVDRLYRGGRGQS